MPVYLSSGVMARPDIVSNNRVCPEHQKKHPKANSRTYTQMLDDLLQIMMCGFQCGNLRQGKRL